MNREIKFRQYIKGIWHFWGFLENGVFIGPANNTSSEEKQEESQQFTGLKDKNGKEIYEGDILKIKSNQLNSEEKIIEVKYETHRIGDFFNLEITGFRDYSKSTYGCKVEVIGNIYENPELLTNN